MKNIFDESQSLIAIFLEALIPEDPVLRKKLATKSKLHKDTFGRLRMRNSLNADTFFRLCLANDISPNAIKAILKKKGDSISKGMVDWIKFGTKLSEKEMEVFLDLIGELREYYLSKKNKKTSR